MKTIAVDIDDVLANTTHSLINHYSQLQGKSFPYGDITSYDYWRSLGVGNDQEAIEIVHNYEKKGYPDLEPIDGAKSAIANLALHHEVVVISARPELFRDITDEWLRTHFGDLFSSVILGGNPYTSQDHKTKATLCVENGASYLVDDQYKHLSDAALLGITGLLFGMYEWSYNGNLTRGVYRVVDWQKVEQFFEDEQF